MNLRGPARPAPSRRGAACAVAAALAAAVPPSASAAAETWVETRPYPTPGGEVADCLRDVASGEVAVLGPLGRSSAATDLLRVGEQGIDRGVRTTLGWLTSCPQIARVTGLPALMAAPVYDPGRRAWALRVAEEGAAPVTLRRQRSEHLHPPAVALAPTGAAAVAWYEQPPGAARRLAMAVRPRAGAPFGRPRTIANGTIGDPVTAPALGIDAAGVVTLGWQTSPRNHVRVAAFDADGTERARQTLTRSLNDTGLTLAVAPDGGALVAALGAEHLELYERPPGGTAFAPVALPVERGSDGELAVALAAGGGAVVADRAEPDTVVAFTRPPGGAFGAPELLAGRLEHDGLGLSSIWLPDGRPRAPEPPTDMGHQALSAAIGRDGEAIVTWVDPPTVGEADGARVARGSLAGGFGRPARIGGRCRMANAIRPLAQADGSLGVAWTDNAAVRRTSSVEQSVLGGGAVHAARAAAVAPHAADADPASRPRAVVTVAGSRALRVGEPLRLRVRCPSGPCDVRAAAWARAAVPEDPVPEEEDEQVSGPDGPLPARSAQADRRPGSRGALRARPAQDRTRAEWHPGARSLLTTASTSVAAGASAELRLVPRVGHRLASPARDRVAVTVTTCAPGGAATARRVAGLRVRGIAPPPVPWIRDLAADRRGGDLVVTWRTAAPAEQATFHVAAWTRGDWDHAGAPVRAAGAGRTRFRVVIPDAAATARTVTVSLETRDLGGVEDAEVALGGSRAGDRDGR